jgi:hypothetical protein
MQFPLIVAGRTELQQPLQKMTDHYFYGKQ